MLILDDHDLQLIKKTIRFLKIVKKKFRNKHSKYLWILWILLLVYLIFHEQLLYSYHFQ